MSAKKADSDAKSQKAVRKHKADEESMELQEGPTSSSPQWNIINFLLAYGRRENRRKESSGDDSDQSSYSTHTPSPLCPRRLPSSFFFFLFSFFPLNIILIIADGKRRRGRPKRFTDDESPNKGRSPFPPSSSIIIRINLNSELTYFYI